MFYTILFWSAVICLSYIGYKLITQGFTLFKRRRRVVFRRVALNDIKGYISDMETKHDIKDFFKHTGLPFTVKNYIAFRFIMLAVLAILGILNVFSDKSDPGMYVLFYLLIAYVTLPRYTFLGVKTPMYLIIDFFKKNYLRNVELELFRILTVLKNLIITCKDKPISAEYIINNLIDFSNLTRPVFTEFLSLYRVNKIDEAYAFFVDEIGTKVGEDFATILIKLDDIEPIDLIEQLELYQGTIRDRCMTERLNKDNFISDIAFFPVVVSIFLILMNFIFITLYIDGMETFNIIF